ncbi:hypothetical protein J1614_006607 [Plenodomus biglobosus]|nr:hypothetical protein J1614_006607 [Plenodomus biglobosus]
MSSAPKSSSPEPDTITPLAPSGLHLQIDFLYKKFQNRISSKQDSTLTPLYIQHFGFTKPQLRFDSLASGTAVQIGTGTANIVSIDSECVLHGHHIALKPLKRWKTEYNYLSPYHSAVSTSAASTTSASPATSDPSPGTSALEQPRIPITWLISMGLKTLELVCLDSATQEPIAKLVVNIWALKLLGNFYFVKSAREVRDRVRDEVVVTGLTLMYVMTSRMNNPLTLLGSLVAKPGRVEGGGEGEEGEQKGVGEGMDKKV